MPASQEHKPEPVFAEERMSNQDLAARIRDLENTLAATRAGMPLNLVPEDGGGHGTDIAPTWSQYDQELAKSTRAHAQLERDIKRT